METINDTEDSTRCSQCTQCTKCQQLREDVEYWRTEAETAKKQLVDQIFHQADDIDKLLQRTRANNEAYDNCRHYMNSLIQRILSRPKSNDS